MLLAVVAMAALFCQFTLYVARRVPGDVPREVYPAAEWRTAAIRASDGAEMKAWFVRPRARSGSGRCVAVLHGVGDSRLGAEGFAGMLLDAGYSVLLPDSRGHGESGGEFVTYGLLERSDAIGWAHWMRGQGCTEIYGLGESLGASILIQASAVEPVFRAIAAECPFADLSAAGEERMRRMLPLRGPAASGVSWFVVASGIAYARVRYGLDFRQVNPVAAMRRTQTPILLIHGTADERTPFWHSQRLAQASPRAVLWLVPGAGHVRASAADPAGFRQRVLGWFAAH